jgi:hypothetical protein
VVGSAAWSLSRSAMLLAAISQRNAAILRMLPGKSRTMMTLATLPTCHGTMGVSLPDNVSVVTAHPTRIVSTLGLCAHAVQSAAIVCSHLGRV